MKGHGTPLHFQERPYPLPLSFHHEAKKERDVPSFLPPPTLLLPEAKVEEEGYLLSLPGFLAEVSFFPFPLFSFSMGFGE